MWKTKIWTVCNLLINKIKKIQLKLQFILSVLFSVCNRWMRYRSFCWFHWYQNHFCRLIRSKVKKNKYSLTLCYALNTFRTSENCVFSVFEIKFQLCARERGTPKKIGSLLCMFLYTVQVRLCRTMFWFSYCVPLKMAQSQNSHLVQKPCEKINIWKFITLFQINSKQYYWYHWNQNKKICWEIPPFYLSVQFKKSLWSTYI